jgi:hypothetical protein
VRVLGYIRKCFGHDKVSADLHWFGSRPSRRSFNSTGTGDRLAKLRSAAPRPPSFRIGGWIPRANS